MKRIISLTLVLAISFSMVVSAQVKGFSDVPQTEWSYNYIMLCAQNGAVNGTTEPDENGIATFAPKMEVTLGQFLAALTKLLCPTVVKPLEEGQHWTLPYYNGAVEAKLINKAEFDYANINEKLSREDMAYILVSAAKFNGEVLEAKDGIENAIADYDTVSANRKDAVEKAYSNGLITGTDANGTFAPNNSMTREQMATVICRLMKWTERAEVNLDSCAFNPAVGHTYNSKFVAPTTSEKGYTLYTCSVCGHSYKDNYVDNLAAITAVQQEIMDSFLEANPIGLNNGYVEDPTGITHTMSEHSFTVTEHAPSCVSVGFTYHQCYECGFRAITEPKYPIGYHSYTATEVIAPAESTPGYTLYTCMVCNDSYKGDYIAPVFKPDGWKGEDYGSGEEIIGNAIIAGQFVDEKGVSRKFYTPGMTRNQAESALNGYVGNVYDYRFFDDGISVNYANDGRFAKIVDNNGRLGVNVFGWRKSYDSDAATNMALNMVMEAFYFFTKDKDVAYALWSWIDAMEINGRANSDNFGFKDVIWNDNQMIIEMNGVKIEYIPGNYTGNTFYIN